MGKRGDGWFRSLFLIASIYDLVLGLAFFSFYKPIFQYLDIALPVYPMYLQMAAAFVIAMGVGYFFVYLRMYQNVDLVKLGVVYKAVYSGLTSYFYFSDLASVVFFWFAVIDFVFLILFVWFLFYSKRQRKRLQ